MNHKFKALGMAFVAVLAMSAVVASAAQANFNSAAYPATISGTQISGTITGTEVTKHQITTKAGTFQCTKVEFMGDLGETQTSLSLAPTYAECTVAGLVNQVTTNGCSFKLHTPETTTASTVDLKMDISCPAGKVIEIHNKVGSCVTTFGPQTNLTGIETHNEATDVKVTFDITGLTYTIHGLCPGKPAAGTYNDGVYKGVATLLGNNGVVKVT